MIIEVALLLSGVSTPEFLTASERWECKFRGFSTEETVTSYFGAYRTHIEDEFGSDSTVVQNDSDALVFVFSDIGNTDVAGATRKWVRVDIIDKKSKRFKRSIVNLESPNGTTNETTGTCHRY